MGVWILSNWESRTATTLRAWCSNPGSMRESERVGRVTGPERADGGVDCQRAVWGVVLAGGRSTRFEDGDKALASVDGEPMLARVTTALSGATDDVVVNCRADQRDDFERVLADADVDARFAVDDRPDEGPLVGLARALDEVDAPVVVVVACDLPWLDAELLAALVDEVGASSDGPEAVVPVDDEGYLKPTCAAYRTSALAIAVESTLETGSRRLLDALESLRVREFALEDVAVPARALADVDAIEDLDR
jgi:molybdopterin-guanine dinucleotide biosynthesis protein A